MALTVTTPVVKLGVTGTTLGMDLMMHIPNEASLDIEAIPVSLADEDQVAKPRLVITGDDVGRDEVRCFHPYPLHTSL